MSEETEVLVEEQPQLPSAEELVAAVMQHEEGFRGMSLHLHELKAEITDLRIALTSLLEALQAAQEEPPKEAK